MLLEALNSDSFNISTTDLKLYTREVHIIHKMKFTHEDHLSSCEMKTNRLNSNKKAEMRRAKMI